MSFSILFFPFVFLPLCLLLYTVTPKRLKNAVLLLCSLVFFAWGRPEYILLLLCSLVCGYFSGRQLDAFLAKKRTGMARFTLITTVLFYLLLLGFFKYYGFLFENITALLGEPRSPQALAAPIGISFYTFSLLSYLFDVYREKAPAAKNIIDFSVYVTFFPKLVSGPIVRYTELEPQLKSHPVTRERFGNGARLFMIGLAKKVLLANTLGTTFYALFAMAPGSLSVASAWLGAVCYSLMLYFDFGGYSDMAIGLGSMFGFQMQKNFDYPYTSSTITEFWRRWHISLGGWFRDYVYIPLGGSRRGNARTICNLLIVWFLTGLWHGANWTFILWGVYYGILLILEKFVLSKLVADMPKLLNRLLTCVLVVIGWVFFFSDSLSGAFSWLGSMFGFGGPLADATFSYYFSASWLLLLISALACVPFAARTTSRLLERKGHLALILSMLFFGALLLLCVASMMNDTYSTFLYGQF